MVNRERTLLERRKLFEVLYDMLKEQMALLQEQKRIQIEQANYSNSFIHITSPPPVINNEWSLFQLASKQQRYKLAREATLADRNSELMRRGNEKEKLLE